MRHWTPPSEGFRSLPVGFAYGLLSFVALAGLSGCMPLATARPAGSERAQAGAGSVEVGYLTPIAELLPADLSGGRRLQVTATTSIVGDVVAQVGGEAIELTILLPAAADPHGFVATPRELAELAEADIVFVNGFGLEEVLAGVLEQLPDEVAIVSVSEGVEGIPMAGDDGRERRQPAEGQPAAEQERHAIDPHVWFDPQIVMQWTRNAAAALGALDPAHREAFRAQAHAYQASLADLDAWIVQRVAEIPPSRRILVTDHFVFDYFARRFGFEVVGAIIPAYSSGASPSPQELAQLLTAIEQHGVAAVFVGSSANPEAAQAVARDAGVRVVTLFSESLGGPGGPAANYLSMMEYNVSAIVEALR